MNADIGEAVGKGDAGRQQIFLSRLGNGVDDDMGANLAATRPTASWVALVVEERTVMNAAPAPNTISASSWPPSTVLLSASTGVGTVRRGGNRPDAETLKQRRADLDDIGNMSNLRKEGQMFWFVECDLQ